MYYNNNSKDYDYYGQVSPNMPTSDTTRTQPQSDGIFTYPQNLQNALYVISEALAGEADDRLFYAWLLGMTSSLEDRDIIIGIRDDEKNHFTLFNQLFYELTGMMSSQVQREQFVSPESYCEGLARALQGEQNAVKKYRKILYAMQDRVHINIMTEIITDEIRHGILYSYLYAKNACKD